VSQLTSVWVPICCWIVSSNHDHPAPKCHKITWYRGKTQLRELQHWCPSTLTLQYLEVQLYWNYGGPGTTRYLSKPRSYLTNGWIARYCLIVYLVADIRSCPYQSPKISASAKLSDPVPDLGYQGKAHCWRANVTVSRFFCFCCAFRGRYINGNCCKNVRPW